MKEAVARQPSLTSAAVEVTGQTRSVVPVVMVIMMKMAAVGRFSPTSPVAAVIPMSLLEKMMV